MILYRKSLLTSHLVKVLGVLLNYHLQNLVGSSTFLPKKLRVRFGSWLCAFCSHAPFSFPVRILSFFLKFVYYFLYSMDLPHKQILLTLPEQHRASYSHLSSNPLLMLEQLLMNMKVDWATVAVQTLQQLMVGQEIGFSMDEVDSLLSRYAEKALDFPYPQREKRSGNC